MNNMRNLRNFYDTTDTSEELKEALENQMVLFGPSKHTNKVIIAAGGESSRWGNYLGVPKHLIKITSQGRTETLVERTARLFRENNAYVYVLGPPDDLRYETPYSALLDTKRLNLKPTKTDQDKVFSSMSFWNNSGRTIVVFGDVWFSEEAVKTILTKTFPIEFYGRFGPSKITGSPYGELFGIAFDYSEHGTVVGGLSAVANAFKKGIIARAAIWELYSWMNNLQPLTKHIKANYFTEINDFTEDFDFPRDYDIWLKRFRMAGN